METPNRTTGRQTKHEPVDEQLRELRGFAVDLKQPVQPREMTNRPLREMPNEDYEQNAHDLDNRQKYTVSAAGQHLPALTYGQSSSVNYVHGVRGVGTSTFNNADMSMSQNQSIGMIGQAMGPHGSVRSSVQTTEHTRPSGFDKYMKGPTSDFQKTTSPRFTQVNKTVGEFISLQSRLQEEPLTNQVVDYGGPEDYQQPTRKQLQQQIHQSRAGQQQRRKIPKEQYEPKPSEVPHTAHLDDQPSDPMLSTLQPPVTQQFVTVNLNVNVHQNDGFFTKSGSKAVGRTRTQSRGSQSNRPQAKQAFQTLQPSGSRGQKSRNTAHKKGQSVDAYRGKHKQAPEMPELDDRERLAMTHNHPQSKRFANAMSKVVNSVQARKKLNIGYQDSQLTNIQALPMSTSQQEGQDMLQSNYRYSGQIVDADMILQKAGQSTTGISGQDSSQGAVGVRTSAHIRDAARREMDTYKSHDGMGRAITQAIANTKSQQQRFVDTEPPRVVEQVWQLVQKVEFNPDKVFVPLDHWPASTRGTTQEATVLAQTKNQDRVKQGNMVFSQNGFVKLGAEKGSITDFISKEQFIDEGVTFMMLAKVPFFKKFRAMKVFKRWKYTMRASVYKKCRQKLAQNFIFSRPIFVERFKPIIEKINEARFLQFIEINAGVQYGKHQQFTLEDRCAKCVKESKAKLEKHLTGIKKSMENLKDEIETDDSNYKKSVKKQHEDEMLRRIGDEPLVMFSKQRQQLELEQSQFALAQHRRYLFNRLAQFIAAYLGANLAEMIHTNKREFKSVFCNQRSGTEFEVSMWFNRDGILDTDPSIKEHRDSFTTIFDQMEDSIFKNQFLIFWMQDLTEFFFKDPSIAVNPTAQVHLRRIVSKMEKETKENVEYQVYSHHISIQLENDIARLQEQLDDLSKVQQVYDFAKEWDRTQSGKKISLEMKFYKETFEKMEEFKELIEKEVPSSNQRLGTILLETLTLKKTLTEYPKHVIGTIRNNVLQTMDNETTHLKEELSRCKDNLEPTPTSLNVYVEQVNTLKYVKQKEQDFESKFNTIQNLHQRCKLDGIRINLGIQTDYELVCNIYDDLLVKRTLTEAAEIGLRKNKQSMEKIMTASSQALSKKIKAFEKKYVANYLQDKTRLEDCAETLEELFKRSTAIHEIKSKVMLYKEFLKLLYEDDSDKEEKLESNQLSCAKDCEFLQEVHKHAIRLWQMLLFWKKRRHLCYKTPFLELDINVILRSITKIKTYFEKKLPNNEFVHTQCQPLTKAIISQVKDTQIIVEFVRELHKDSLQRRHWIQIFDLIKAAHLKNSTSFTIVDLREYNIQNYSDEIKLIIDHAFTESRYETVFRSIKEEWEKAELKIVPFKESLKDYVISNTETMSDAIEENLGTLETISRSAYATHVRKEIGELMGMLSLMLSHLDKWVAAQKYWVTLDPVYNSGIFPDLYGANTTHFLDTRSQFRRIMWSSYRNPSATYNLMIDDRIPTFNTLSAYYLQLQQRVHEYLEEKRLQFTRFFFLNDSQFLDFLMRANSNQDVSAYVSMLFQGAQKFFVTQIKSQEHAKLLARQDSLGLEASYMENQEGGSDSNLDEESDLENQLEDFMRQGVEGVPRELEASTLSLLEIQHAQNKALGTAMPLPTIDLHKAQHQLDPIFKVGKKEGHGKGQSAGAAAAAALREGIVLQRDSSDEESDFVQSSSASGGSLHTDATPGGKPNSMDQARAEINFQADLTDSDREDPDKLVQLSDFYVLGMVSLSKELLLFDRQVQMSRRVEQWLARAEDAMRLSVKKHMKNGILRFANQPIEEWILDYPQQVSISVLHLVLCQEIQDRLAGVEYEPIDPDDASNATFHEERVTVGKPDPTIQAAALRDSKSGVTATTGQGSKADETRGEEEAKQGQQSTSTQRAAARARANQSGDQDAYKLKVLKSRVSNAPPLSLEAEQADFLDDAFGEGVAIEAHLDAAQTEYTADIAKLASKNVPGKAGAKALLAKRAEYKEQVMQVLQHRGLHSLWLRMAFWVNKFIALLHMPRQERHDKPAMNFELLGIQKVQIKSLILFLKYQQETIERLQAMKVDSDKDFEWASKFKTVWSLDDEARAECGGWAMNLGYEYLGTQNRLLITPLTERYFVYLSSALREKSSVMLQCIPEHQRAYEVVEEMASLCAVPFRTIQCSQHSNLSALTQLLNGCSMASVWLFFEHIDRLPMVGLSILLKEIQLIHQQYVVSNFQAALRRNMRASSDVSTTFEDLPSSRVNIGIFASIQHTLPLRTPDLCKEFCDQARTSFRVLALNKPDLGIIFKALLFAENYTLPDDTAAMLGKYLEVFEAVKTKRLYHGEKDPDVLPAELSLSNLRQALKLASLLRHQEVQALSQKQIDRATAESQVLGQQFSPLDKFDVEATVLGPARVTVRQKTADRFIHEREVLEAKRVIFLQDKYKIEIDSLREGLRVVIKGRVAKEWTRARVKQCEEAAAKGKPLPKETADMKWIEYELDRAILEAFEETVDYMKITHGQAPAGEDPQAPPRAEPPGAEEGTKEGEAEDEDEEEGGDKVAQLQRQMTLAAAKEEEAKNPLTSKARPQRDARLAQRRENVRRYLASDANLAPKPALVRYHAPGGRPVLIKHASVVGLTHSAAREEAELEFRQALYNGVLEVAEELNITVDEHQVYNCLGLVELMRRNKGVAIVGPACSGKTQLVKLATIALRRTFSVQMRSTYVSPSTFTGAELFGPVHAFERTMGSAPENGLQRKSVFQIILHSYEREKLDLRPAEANRLIQAIYIDSQEVHTDLADCLAKFLLDTNIRERDYQKEKEFILDFSKGAKKVQPANVQRSPIRFPNGNVTMVPSDTFFFFECQSMAHASPAFVSSVGIVNTQDADVTQANLFQRQLKLCEKKHAGFIEKHKVTFGQTAICAKEFVIPFIAALDEHEEIHAWPYWNVKQLTMQFFVILNAFLYRLQDNCELNIGIEDPMDYPFDEMKRDVLWNLMLCATTWSFGAVLSRELKQVYDEQFNQYRNKFNINLAMTVKKSFTLFDIYFDVERLTWSLIGEQLEYKLKVYYDKRLNACLLPTPELAQAYFVQAHVVMAQGKEKDLNKHLRLVGPSSSSKTVILNTFQQKLTTPVTTITVPMTAYLTLERLRFKIEEQYTAKRKNTLVPADPNKRVLLVIDDIHLQRNLGVEVLEFIRSWSICRGYFDVPAGFFKKIGEFGTMTAENSAFQATSRKTDRFVHDTTTIYCEEITVDKYKPFVQTWFTTTCWQTSPLVTKYYILMTNALVNLAQKMKYNEVSFSNSSLSRLHKFQYIAKFCANVVHSSLNTEKDDVFNTGQLSERREEDAVADIFCYEAMRTFGDRIMRPQTRVAFQTKLAEIAQREFLCSKEDYTPEYCETLILGDYHAREPKAHVTLTKVSEKARKKAACTAILEKCKAYTGNQLLQFLLDVPTGLSDLYKISRTFFKEGQHLALVGPAGTSKHELMQLSAILNDTVILELDVPCFGQPLQFATAFKNALKSAAKLNTPVVIQISESQLRDPVYFDYVYTYMQQISRLEECVLFDPQFREELITIEKQHMHKLKTVAMPSEEKLFLNAAARVQRTTHVVFLFSDLMAYKECFQLFPQFEYLCEVVYLDDINDSGYVLMADSFLSRSNIAEEMLGEQTLAGSLGKIRYLVKQKWVESFYSPKMLAHGVWEETLTYRAAEFVFPDGGKVTGNIFAGDKGFTVTDNELRHTLFNMPMEVAALSKHRFGMFLEVFRFLYDLLGMHLSLRLTYCETFLQKTAQFTEFFESVKGSKKDLQDRAGDHKLSFGVCRQKIIEIQAQLKEKNLVIAKKQAEMTDLDTELEAAKSEEQGVIKEKSQRLGRIIDNMSKLDQQQYNHFLVANEFTDREQALLDVLAHVAQVGKEHKEEWGKDDFDLLFWDKSELINTLDNRRRCSFDDQTFSQLQGFIQKRGYTEYNENPLTEQLYDYFQELYRLTNIKNTLATTYFKISEIEQQIDANEFSITYARGQIDTKQHELEIQQERFDTLQKEGNVLSRHIEEAEISHMRTEHIFENISSYTERLKNKKIALESRVRTLLGDAMLLATSVVYLGPFSPEERHSIRTDEKKGIIQYLINQRGIECNHIWHRPLTGSALGKSMFIKVLKDFGFKEMLKPENMPSVLNADDLAETLFSVLVAPSLPVICDPTGQFEEFIRTKFLANFGHEKISGADIFANEKIHSVLQSSQIGIITDVNCMRKQSSGLSQDLPLLKRLATTMFNGFDFHDVRTAKLKKIGVIDSFFSHFSSSNKRIQCFYEKLENISIHQLQVFQSKFDFQLNKDEFLQNSTFICCAPSLAQDKADLEMNPAIITIKELFMKSLLQDTTDFDAVKQKLQTLNAQMSSLDQKFQNSFLIASGETLKKLVDYHQLKTSVEEIIAAKETRAMYQKKYEEMLASVQLLSEAAKVIFNIYMSLKQVSKIMSEVTYSWTQFIKIIELLIVRLIKKKKEQAIGRCSQMSMKDSMASTMTIVQPDIELEIDQYFFTEELLPMINKTMMSNVKVDSVSFFNLILSLRLAKTYGTITQDEMNYIINQLITLQDFWKWRASEHEFIKLEEPVSADRMKKMRKKLSELYPDMTRNVFDLIEKSLRENYTYHDLSLYLQTVIKEKYSLSPEMMVTFGFICPDHEFQAKLTHFMYSTIESTFTFSEDLFTLKQFCKIADWKDPIALMSSSEVNVTNLITSIASYYGIPTLVLRTDPVVMAAQAAESLQNSKERDIINSNLLDLTNIRQNSRTIVDHVRFKNLAQKCIQEPISGDAVIAKQNWYCLKQRNANLDEGSIVHEINLLKAEESPVNKIIECARNGSWVLICPIQFPQYFVKLGEKLAELKESEVNKNFRLFFDLQGLTQNEIPDNFLFDKCVTMHLEIGNMDNLPGYNDIWDKLLNVNYLEILTDLKADRKAMNQLSAMADFQALDIPVSKNMKYIFERQSESPQKNKAFKAFAREANHVYSEQYQSQLIESLKRQEEEHQRKKFEEKEQERRANEMMSNISLDKVDEEQNAPLHVQPLEQAQQDGEDSQHPTIATRSIKNIIGNIVRESKQTKIESSQYSRSDVRSEKEMQHVLSDEQLVTDEKFPMSADGQLQDNERDQIQPQLNQVKKMQTMVPRLQVLPVGDGSVEGNSMRKGLPTHEKLVAKKKTTVDVGARRVTKGGSSLIVRGRSNPRIMPNSDAKSANSGPVVPQVPSNYSELNKQSQEEKKEVSVHQQMAKNSSQKKTNLKKTPRDKQQQSLVAPKRKNSTKRTLKESPRIQKSIEKEEKKSTSRATPLMQRISEKGSQK